MTCRGLPHWITESPFSDLYVRSESRLELKRGVKIEKAIRKEKKRICLLGLMLVELCVLASYRLVASRIKR
jgi:hypothetical protein